MVCFIVMERRQHVDFMSVCSAVVVPHMPKARKAQHLNNKKNFV